MKIAAHVLAYNVTRFLKPVLENLEPHVDKIYIAHAEKPFGYIEKSRETLRNPTKIADIQAASSSNKIEVISGDWKTEEDMRNDCLIKARQEGFDWFITQDADEFYSETAWKQIKNILLRNKSDDHFITTWYNFWKSSHYVLMDMNGGIKSTNAGFALRCASDIKFIDRRLCNNQHRKVIDTPCHHYSYVMSDTEMAEKIATWSHAHQLYSSSWYKYKWLNWSESSKWLNPVYPMEYLRAVRFPMEQPDFAEQFALPLGNTSQKKTPGFGDVMGENLYDASVHMVLAKNSIKKIVKSLLS